MSKRVNNFLRTFDLFGQPITLSLDNNENFTSSCGGCFSLCMIGLLTAIFFS